MPCVSPVTPTLRLRLSFWMRPACVCRSTSKADLESRLMQMKCKCNAHVSQWRLQCVWWAARKRGLQKGDFYPGPLQNFFGLDSIHLIHWTQTLTSLKGAHFKERRAKFEWIPKLELIRNSISVGSKLAAYWRLGADFCSLVKLEPRAG